MLKDTKSVGKNLFSEGLFTPFKRALLVLQGYDISVSIEENEFRLTTSTDQLVESLNSPDEVAEYVFGKGVTVNS